MLSHIEIRNYQSLADVRLTLGRFTVIVGPSSSGKSAFTRALKTLTSNQRGDSFITHGESQCIITARTDHGTVALLRGKKNEYVLIPEDDSTQQQTFTKLAGAVPEEVSAFIGIPSSDPLNYADQFDMPYMLKRSGGDVARELGALTNVSVIFEASREANRRRLAASGTLKTRAADYQDLTKNLDRYQGLTQQRSRLEEITEEVKKARHLETRISVLGDLTAKLTSAAVVPEKKIIPSAAGVEEAAERFTHLDSLLGKIHRSTQGLLEAEQNLEVAQQSRITAEAEYTEALRAAGTCPTCGGATHDIHL